MKKIGILKMTYRKKEDSKLSTTDTILLEKTLTRKYHRKKKKAMQESGHKLCDEGLRLRHEWADSVANADKNNWQPAFFSPKGFWKHIKSCTQCQEAIKC